MPGSPTKKGEESITPYQEESMRAFKRARELEQVVQKLTARLAREQKHRSSLEEQEKNFRTDVERMRREWQTNWERELQRVRAECENKLLAAEAQHKFAADMENQIKTLKKALVEQSKSAEEKERDARVELVAKRSVRRMLRASLAAGWEAWHELYLAKVRQRQMLARAAARLSKPALIAAFGFWQNDWDHAKLAAEKAGRSKLTEQLEARQIALQAQLELMQKEFERKLIAAEAEKREALEKQRQELSSSADAQLRAKEEAEKEARIEYLRRSAMRRIMNQDLSFGFIAWCELWSAKVSAMKKLRAVANKLKSPGMGSAFTFWMREYLREAKERGVELASKSAEQARAQARRMNDFEAKVKALTEEVKVVTEARDNLAEEMRQILSAAAEKESKLAAEQDNEREARIVHMRKQAMRRMLNADLSFGWSAWYDFWSAKTYAYSKLREVAGRLRSPERAQAFAFWKSDWDETQKEAMLGQHNALAEALTRERNMLANELKAVREEHVRALEAASADKYQALERLRMELTGTVEEQLRAKEAMEKEARIEYLRRSAMRRIMNQDLSFGFNAWMELWSAKTYAMQRLRTVAMRLKAPGLGDAFHFWIKDTLATKNESTLQGLDALKAEKAEMEAERNEAQEELERLRKVAVEQLNAMNDERLKLLERIAQLTGGAEETEAALEAKLMAEKEARIEHLRKSAMRRMLNADLSWAWSCWFDLWDAKSYALSRLREVAGRLQSPERAKAFAFWKEDWDAKQQEAVVGEIKQRENALTAERDVLQEQLDKLAAESDKKLKELERKLETEMLEALERQRIELAGTAEEQAQLLAEEEKEKRIEMLRRQAALRIKNADIVWAFEGWYEMWYAIAKLKAIGNSLRAPGLGPAFRQWGEVALEMKRQKAVIALEKQSKGLETQLRGAEFEAGQLKLTNVHLEDEVYRLRSKLKSTDEEAYNRSKELSEVRNSTIPQLSSLNDEIAMLRRRLQEAAEVVSVAERKRVEAETETAEQRKKNQKLFERLVTEQRQNFEKDTLELTQSLALALEQRSALEKQLADMRAESDSLQRKVDVLEGTAQPLSPDKQRKKRSGVLGNFSLEEGPDAPDVSEQILKALRASSSRILDLFREWDKDGDGKISRREFIEAMPRMGIDVGDERAGEIFDGWDTDGGGALTLRELQRSLSRASAVAKAKAQMSGTVKAMVLATRAGSVVPGSAASTVAASLRPGSGRTDSRPGSAQL